MNFDSSIKQMLSSYPDAMPQIDKLREVLQQTTLLGLARHQFFQHAVFYGGTALHLSPLPWLSYIATSALYSLIA